MNILSKGCAPMTGSKVLIYEKLPRVALNLTRRPIGKQLYKKLKISQKFSEAVENLRNECYMLLALGFFFINYIGYFYPNQWLF
ncbi:hypothetical protein GCM10022260_21440 [Gaetbulibacter aestuarii]